jgi:hypothetical protein
MRKARNAIEDEFKKLTAAADKPPLTKLIKRAVKGESLKEPQKDKVEKALGQPIGEPERKDNAKTGTLQPPALGLGGAHLLMPC